jgi:hypothetical protein
MLYLPIHLELQDQHPVAPYKESEHQTLPQNGMYSPEISPRTPKPPTKASDLTSIISMKKGAE